MPPITRRDGRPLIARVGSSIPFSATEEKDNFRRIQELVVEFNSRSQKRISVTLVSSDGSVLLLGTKGVISTVLKSTVVPETVAALHNCSDWFSNQETETFKVPLVRLPSKNELISMDEAGCEGIISNMLNKINYPCVNHFAKKETIVPYCWPTQVTPKAPSTISLVKDNSTGITFASRKSFLLFIFQVMLYGYFHNLLFEKLGLVINAAEDCSYVSSESFTTELPFDTHSVASFSREVQPCSRKVSGIERAMKTSEDAQTPVLDVQGKETRGDDALPSTSPNQSNEINSLVNSSDSVRAVNQKPVSLKGMPFLKSFDASVQDENNQQGRVVRTSVPRVLKMRRYKKKTIDGKDDSTILCICPNLINLSLIQTVRCQCGNLTHVACVSNVKGVCFVCSSK